MVKLSMRRKILLLIIFVFLFFQIGTAHIDFDSFGLKMGLNAAKFIVESPYITTQDFQLNSHLNIGLFTDINMSKFLDFSLGIYYLTQGAYLSSFGSKFYYSLNYASIPLEIQIFLSHSKTKFYLFTGSQFSFLVGSDLKTESLTSWWGENSTIITHDKIDWASKFDLYLSGGIGTKIIFNKMVVLLEFKILYGLTDINTDSDEKYQNFSFQINFGVGLYNGVLIF